MAENRQNNNRGGRPSSGGSGRRPARGGAKGGSGRPGGNRGASQGSSVKGGPRQSGPGRPSQGRPSQGRPAQGGSFQGGKPGGNKPGANNSGSNKPAAAGSKPRPGRAGAGKLGAKGNTPPKADAQRPYANTDRYGRKMPDKVAIYGPHRRRRPKNPPVDRLEVHDSEGVRLQKLLANAGVASRRVCEEMITEGRVTVDGEVVTELGVRVDSKTAEITVNGLPIQLDDKLVYYAFNKPEGVVSTMGDQEGRQCISDFLIPHRHQQRIFHVGRLDIETEGLLLLTNDGELTNRLTHPSYEVPKTYLVQVRGPMEKGIGDRMKEGIMLDDGMAKVDSFRLVDSVPGHILVEVVLHSGRNRIVRRLFDAVGHPVERLVRTQVGPIRIGNQKQGVVRDLSKTEVGHLLASVGLSS